MNREQTHKVKVKYPEIREIVHKLWRYAFRAGQNYSETGEQADSYDFSSAYQEIEKILELPQEEIREIGEDEWHKKNVIDIINKHTRAINKLKKDI